MTNGHLRDPNGRAVILRGVNLSGEHKRRPYLGFHTEADFKRVRRDWGMNAIRFLVSWSGVEPQKGQYDQSYLDAVRTRMDWAHRTGLLVVLDMHQDVYGEGFGGNGAPGWTCPRSYYEAFKPVSPWFANYTSPQVMGCFDRLWANADGVQVRYAEAWRQLALRLGDHPAVVGFDVINEPHWGSHGMFTFEQEQLAPFYDRVVNQVRQVAPHWLAFLEPSSSRNLGIATSLTARPYDNVVYAPHSYDAQAEQGQGFDPSRRKAIMGNIENLAAEARALGAALWIGEYGGVAADPGIGAYMDAHYDAAGAVGAGSMYWEYTRGSGYGLLNPDGSEKAVLVNVLARPYPCRVAGDLSWFGYDENRTFTMEYRPDATVNAPTEIIVPHRVYPAGFSVDCGGCTYHSDGDRLLITRPGSNNVGRVTVRPVY